MAAVCQQPSESNGLQLPRSRDSGASLELHMDSDLFTIQRKGTSTGLRRMKAHDLKARADESLKKGNHREAYLKYTECLETKPDRQDDHKILSNRSLAYLKAGKPQEALDDAERVVVLAPGWEKGHYRQGSALLALRRTPEAVLALQRALQLTEGDGQREVEVRKEVSRLVREAVLKLTQAQLAEGILDMCDRLVEEGKMEPPEKETVSRPEMVEGLFQEIRSENRFKGNPSPYHQRYLVFALEGITLAQAYSQRSAMYCSCKCYKQARLDGEHAIMLAPDWAEAHHRRGAACIAEEGSDAADWVAAVRSYARAVEMKPGEELYEERLVQAGRKITNEEMTLVLDEIYQNVLERFPTSVDLLENPDGCNQQRSFRCEIIVKYPEGRGSSFGAQARAAMRQLLAQKAGVAKIKVLIAGVKAGPPLTVSLQVLCGANKERGDRLVASLSGSAAEVFCADALSSLGPIDDSSLSATVVDITPLAPEDDVACGPLSDGSKDRRLYHPARPKMEIELPYKFYKLVRGDGAAVERGFKHPFQISRVFWTAIEKPEATWVEPMDGVLRWKQTGGEVVVIGLKVPADVRPRQIDVNIDIRTIRVAHKATGEVYLEGELEREVVPEESVWEHNGGSNEEGFVLTLQKMNLELFQEDTQQSRMWWPRLFTCHAEIAWDDYEKDYSDLPDHLVEDHWRYSAQQKSRDRVDNEEKKFKEREEEKEALRKQTRSERLRKLGIPFPEPKEDDDDTSKG